MILIIKPQRYTRKGLASCIFITFEQNLIFLWFYWQIVLKADIQTGAISDILSDCNGIRVRNSNLPIQATIECGFTLKCLRDMMRTYSQVHRTDKYSQYNSISWPAWLNGGVFVYELNGCGFDSRCSHLYRLVSHVI